jgi:hypothetical protein
MSTFAHADTMHRLVKQAVDSGSAATLDEAEQLFRGYRLSLVVDRATMETLTGQIAVLTAVALARRVFLGGVDVVGPVDVGLVVPMPLGDTLRGALRVLGGQVVDAVADARAPAISIGSVPELAGAAFHMRMSFTGWRGGVVPADHLAQCDAAAMPLAPMLAAGLAVSEAFSFIRGEGGSIGRRAVLLSLWKPESIECDLNRDENEPALRFLPAHLWLIGLGHLGQAYLWALGLLPYPCPAAIKLVMQDTDVITPSTESTSVLTDASMVGRTKARAMAAWAERRGFRTSIYERLFDGTFRRQEVEPAVALCGVDNAQARRALDTAGFPLVVEAGLGSGYADFRALRVHTLPASRTATEIWKVASGPVEVANRPAYRDLLTSGQLDQCGVTLLAGKAVGAPFVGAVAACLVIAEVLRVLHGGTSCQLVDLDLQCLEHRVVVTQERDFSTLNPGYVNV